MNDEHLTGLLGSLRTERMDRIADGKIRTRLENAWTTRMERRSMGWRAFAPVLAPLVAPTESPTPSPAPTATPEPSPTASPTPVVTQRPATATPRPPTPTPVRTPTPTTPPTTTTRPPSPTPLPTAMLVTFSGNVKNPDLSLADGHEHRRRQRRRA